MRGGRAMETKGGREGRRGKRMKADTEKGRTDRETYEARKE